MKIKGKKSQAVQQNSNKCETASTFHHFMQSYYYN